MEQAHFQATQQALEVLFRNSNRNLLRAKQLLDCQGDLRHMLTENARRCEEFPELKRRRITFELKTASDPIAAACTLKSEEMKVLPSVIEIEAPP